MKNNKIKRKLAGNDKQKDSDDREELNSQERGKRKKTFILWKEKKQIGKTI